jgi:FeS assembly SUF system protein
VHDSPIDRLKRDALQSQVVEVLRTVYDPELPVNIYDLGLIYDVAITPDNEVKVKMTLTTPACPVAGTLPPQVEQRINAIDGVTEAKVELVWDPPWTPDRMTDAAKLELNMDLDDDSGPKKGPDLYGVGFR